MTDLSQEGGINFARLNLLRVARSSDLNLLLMAHGNALSFPHRSLRNPSSVSAQDGYIMRYEDQPALQETKALHVTRASLTPPFSLSLFIYPAESDQSHETWRVSAAPKTKPFVHQNENFIMVLSHLFHSFTHAFTCLRVLSRCSCSRLRPVTRSSLPLAPQWSWPGSLCPGSSASARRGS